MPLLADVQFSTEGVVVISGLMGGLVTAVVKLFMMYDKSKNDAIALLQSEKQRQDEESKKKSFQEIAEEAVAIAEARAERKRIADGGAPVKKLVPVVPEHSSPVTKEQQDAADLQTLRARVTAAALALDHPAREAGPPEHPPTPVEELRHRTIAVAEEGLRTDIAEVRADVADVKADVADTPAKTAEEIKKRTEGDNK